MKYELRPQTVTAHRFDGENMAFLETALEEHCGEPVRLDSPWLSVGTYLVLHERQSWELSLPSVFEAAYRPVPTFKPITERSCFHCHHFALVRSTSYCALYDENIYDETAEAKSCMSYELDPAALEMDP